MKSISALTSLRNHWRDDLRAGFNVSLIALPLSLGIALASGFPPIAGLYAAIIGGLLVSRINGSFVTIVGPAAGLIVVNLSAIEMLGQGDNAVGYRYALSAIFFAGLLVALLGWLRAGKFGDFFPSAAVHGMLAAIGVIIMVKQFFVAVAVRAHGHEFYEIVEEIPVALSHANPEVVLITLVSLAILILYPKTNVSWIKMVPAPIWVLVVAIPLEFVMDFEHEHVVRFLGEAHKVGPQLLVHLPDRITDGLVLPDFGKVATGTFWVVVLTIALVTALESVLSAIAVDSLDPMQRQTNLNKDLKGLGVGTSFSGAIGGLPMISEIVRSSANVSSGAKTGWANFFHGMFLLLFLLVGGPVINHIPLAALAAMLLFTGYRLASPKEFRQVYHTGKSELLVFVATIVMVLLTDLLIGVGIGIVLNLLVVWWKGTAFQNLFRVEVTAEEESSRVILHPKGALVFSNYLGLKRWIGRFPGKSIVIDLSQVRLVDHSVLHHWHKLERAFEAQGLHFTVHNDQHLTHETDHPLSARRLGVGKERSASSWNAHQVTLSGIAYRLYADFLPLRSLQRIRDLSKFTLSRKGTVKFVQNEIRGHFDTQNWSYLELDFDTDLQTRASTHTLGVVLVDFDETELPVFTLEPEGLMDRLAGIVGWDDIDFQDHPGFSERFLLKGKDETAIRAIFDPAIIRHIMSQPHFALESDGRRLLIYRHDGQLEATMAEALISFAKQLTNLMQQRLQPANY